MVILTIGALTFVIDFPLKHLSEFANQLSVSENISGQKNLSRNKDIVLSLHGRPISLCNLVKTILPRELI